MSLAQSAHTKHIHSGQHALCKLVMRSKDHSAASLFILSQNHGITEWFGLEGTLKTILFNPLPLPQSKAAPWNLALETSRDPRAAPASLGSQP